MVSPSSVIAGAYIAYAVATIWVFLKRPPLQAALLCSFAGWLFLPVADYPAKAITKQGFTVDVIGTVLPSNLLITKTLIVPLAVLAGLAFGAPRLFRDFRFTMMDAAMACFCLSPLLACAAGRTTVATAIVQAGYLAGVWGATWMIGRVILADQAGRQGLIEAIVVSGLVLVPVAVLEGLHPAWLYNAAFGPHPFQVEGAVRYFSFRPLGFFEHGNQYGIWMAIAALAALFRALRRQPRSWGDIAVAGLLAGCAILSQSVGAILLLIFGGMGLLMPAKAIRQGLIAAAAVLLIGGPVYLSGKVPIQRLAETTAAGRKALGVLHATGRESLGYRVRRDQMALPMIYRAPLTGYGAWDWWRPLESHPWGLPLLIAGQFGLLSLLLAAIALLGGALRELWQGSRSVLPIIVVVAAIDAWLNSYVYFPAFLAAAAMARPFWRDQPKPGRPENGALAPSMAEQTGAADGR